MLLGAVGISGLYLWAISDKERARYPDSQPVSPWRITAFFAGILAFIIALLSPIEPLADDFLLTAHMVQHILITLIGPLLMLLGVPPWLWSAIAKGLGRGWDLWIMITRPVPAFLIFNLTFAFVHIPGFYNLALENTNVHILEHVLLWGTAFIAWWCVVAPSPELGELQPGILKGVYLLANTIPGQIVGALITFSNGILYEEYNHAPRMWGLSPTSDQQLGGLIMWVGVGTFYVIAAMIIFFKWAAEEEAKERRGPVRLESQGVRKPGTGNHPT